MGLLLATTSKGLIEMPLTFNYTQTISFYELHDRMILATAKFLDIPITSSDSRFSEIQEISTIWD